MRGVTAARNHRPGRPWSCGTAFAVESRQSCPNLKTASQVFLVSHQAGKLKWMSPPTVAHQSGPMFADSGSKRTTSWNRSRSRSNEATGTFCSAANAPSNLAPDRLTALQRRATIESIGSSTRIEGDKLSNHQVAQLLASLSSLSFRSRDEQEVAGYARVMDMVFEAWRDIPLDENHLKQLHAELLKFSEKDERHRGDYKKFPNYMAAFDSDGKQIGVVFETTSPFDTPREMAALLHWFKQAQAGGSLHPLLRTAVFIVRFLAVHPFHDGNGRLPHILTEKDALASLTPIDFGFCYQYPSDKVTNRRSAPSAPVHAQPANFSRNPVK